jgi:hypothetical protein
VTVRSLVLLPLALGCAGAAPIAFGDPQAPPAIEALPPLPADHVSAGMRASLELSERVLAIRPPRLPDDFSSASLTAWCDGELERWLADKMRAIEEAEAELVTAARESYSQRVITAALIGLLYEDVARVIENVPPPDELLDEPAMLLVYRDVYEAKALPFRQSARRGYRRCAFNAQAGDRYAGWSRFCSERDAELEPRYTGTGTELRVEYE